MDTCGSSAGWYSPWHGIWDGGRGTTSNLSLAAFTTQMGRMILAHEKYLLSVRISTGEARAGKETGASLIVDNETQPRHAVGQTYFIS